SVGPTSKSLSLAADARDPAARPCSFDEMAAAFREQVEALRDGGADLILLETCFDALNAKALISALDVLGNPLPLIVSATVSDASGRTLTGQTLEAFYHSVAHAPTLAAFGINCALGARKMASLVAEIAAFSRHPLIFYPNAGIPDESGCYHDSPAQMAAVMGDLASHGLLNIAGGCCGSTPEHIRAIAEAVRVCPPRVPLSEDDCLCVSGLEAYAVDGSRHFTNIGERTNVAGSRAFARLIEQDDYEGAVRVAAAQIEGGAPLIDINTDDPLVDPTEKMRAFLRYAAADPAVSRAAFVLDSSQWDTLVEGLKNCTGRSIVNSLSLKDGEAEFLRRARAVHVLGAAMVVMAFDERGQAETLDRKIEICRRSYALLTEAGIPSRDIIFDCNVLTIGTGIPEHARFGVDFIDAVRWIKENLPGAKTSGGISNLSFAFRGNRHVREAMHAVFLYHAVRAGLDMAIVNPQLLIPYDAVEPALREAVEDVLFDRAPEATARLLSLAAAMQSEEKGMGPESASPAAPGTPADPVERLSDALVRGDATYLSADVEACRRLLGGAVQVIEGPLMQGMERVGQRFAEGRMFLPQVMKSAKLMRDAVAFLQPFLGGTETSSRRPKFLIATVQGDVHDIGKNITAMVLQCSGFDVTDLGVMVPCGVLLDKAQEIGADIIGVSGLITPSLRRMEEICAEMSARGMTQPLFVGGAAASAMHTAIRLFPLYANVHYGADASHAAVLAGKYMADPAGVRAAAAAEYRRLAALRADAAARGTDVPAPAAVDAVPAALHFDEIPLQRLEVAELLPFFDWRMFFAVCGVKGEDASLRAEALSLMRTAGPSVWLCARFVDCHREADVLVAGDLRLPMLRDGRSLADFFPEEGSAPLGLFAIRSASPSAEGAVPLTEQGLLAHAVDVTLAEAASAWLHAHLSATLPDGVKLILPGIGYACCPDHSLKRDILAQLPPELGIRLTDSCAMLPEASICGLAIAHPAAAYHDIRHITPEAISRYAALRGFSPQETALFLGFLSLS
ncbi:MAG: homocysteine S-methyltransferase family protein, partial [Bacteroidales bacterium]|nr:homocysteine S-methyltransferase family protein [Bacteroidales bacterium]